ncbi:hypothetical protein CROQUDRAFT_651535 [Cronartium quercuum f. sp. fusiforme G11]|uniref:Pentatricopeptide repeat-containing protein n=1 Tax=Cronartium quercuum f. sp. fusiforme G11 TaxID=708437 RepID=A0A9P6NS70_9BASI|nr:hypothetical protein CROQUDRAFT_651535 [Cronartium quercuum f. sp. fusiforme G11]
MPTSSLRLLRFKVLIGPSTKTWFNRSFPPYGYLPLNDQQQHSPHRPAYPTPTTIHPLPRLSPSIASLHNAALVHLHRGLNLPPDHPDAYHSAVVRGFHQIVRLDTGLEYALPRQTLLSLLNLVTQRLSRVPAATDPNWPASASVLILAGTRPTIVELGEWAWDSIKRAEYSLLFEIWAGIRDAPARRRALTHHSLTFGPGAPEPPQPPSEPISLDGQFFTALVAVSAGLADGPPLASLIQSLLGNVCSYIHWPHQRPSPLKQLPDPERAIYFIRSVELALMWQRPIQINTLPSNPQSAADEQAEEEIEEMKTAEPDERIVRMIQRTLRNERDGGRRAAQELWERVREAVDGPQTGAESGWLKLDWKEPVIRLNSTNLIEEDVSEHSKKLDPSSSSVKSSPTSILLTQRLVGVFLTAFSRLGMLEKVEEVISFVRASCGGMSLYLWAAILRGLVWRQDYVLTKRFYDRMWVEDRIKPDINVSCLMISTSFGSPAPKAVDEGLAVVDDLLANEPEGGCPTEALNIIISALLRYKLIERAEELVRKLKGRLNTTTLNHFLNFHSRHHHQPDLQGVLATLNRFEALAIRPDVVSFTILLNVLMKLGCGRAGANKLLEMMERLGVKANAITYGSIIHHLCRSGQADELEIARGLMDEIEQKGIATTAITYTALIQGYLRAYVNEYRSGKHSNKFEEVTGLIRRMKAHGHIPNEVIEHALLDSLLCTGQPTAALELFRSLTRRDIEGYGIVLRRLKEAGHIKLAKEVLVELRREMKAGMGSGLPRWIERIVLDIEHSW